MCLLVGNVLPDALCELLEDFKETALNGILAHAEEMLKHTLELLVQQVSKAHSLPLTFPPARLFSHSKVAEMRKR